MTEQRAPATFQFGNRTWDHSIGDEDCEPCWGGYPVRCHCGGIVHAEFGDENANGDYWLSYCCDRCGETLEPERGS